MVEAVFVISVFILFFLGMAYFRSMYQQKLRVSRLARAAAVGYALNGCQGDPLALINQDLGSASNGGQSGSTQGSTQGVTGQAGSKGDPTVSGNSGSGNPVSSSLGSSGMTGDPIAVLNLQGPAAAGTTQSSPWATKIGFSATVSTSSYMSCGDVAQPGTAAGAWNYAEKFFNL